MSNLVFVLAMLTLLTCVDSEGDVCVEKDLMSCPTTVTATTTAGVSLVQAVSSKMKVAAKEVREARLKQAVESNQKEAQAIGKSSVRQASDRLQAQARSFSEWCCRGVDDLSKRRSSSVVLFLVLILLLLAAIYFFMTRPEAIGSTLKSAALDHTGQRQQPAYGMPPRTPTDPSLQRRQIDPAVGSRMGSMGSPFQTSKFGSPSVDGRNFDGMVRPAEVPGSSDESSETETSRFCRDLVVPQQCECILQVPVYAPTGRFSICDTNGRAVLHAVTATSGPGGPLWNVALKTAHGDPLAHCVEVSASEFNILGAKGEYFGRLGPQYEGAQRFVLTTQSGEKLHFWGNFQTQAVNVTDEQNGLLATTEPCEVENARGLYYRLRVAPLANVGHSLCALLCIGQVLRSSRLADL